MTFVRKAFDKRDSRNVRKSSTFKCEPLRDTEDQGEDVFDVDRCWRGFFCVAFTYMPFRLQPKKLGRIRIVPQANALE